jgi:hypothetical protein
MPIGVVLVIIGLPLVLGYYIGGKKNVMWRNLGMITIGLGVFMMVTS